MVRCELLTSHILPTHMLNQLTIRNYVLVDHLDISFAPGNGNYRGIRRWQIDFVGALGLLMGDRAKAESVDPALKKLT